MSFSANEFTGGMNDWLDPRLLSATVAAKLENCDVDNGKIVPVIENEKKDHGDPTYYGHYGSRDRSVIKYYDRFYWSNNEAEMAPYYGGNDENYLGIPYPAYSGSGKNADVAADSPASGESTLTGNYKYCVTFVNENGWEGAPGSLEEYEVPLVLSGQVGKITVTWDDDDERIFYAKIYRTISNGADFYNVGEIHTSGGTFRDTIADSSAQLMNRLSTEDNYPPPDGGKFLTEYGGVFFLAQGSLLYFSKQGNPHAWPTVQFLSIDDTITGIVPEFQGILVFTRNKAFRITGADDTSTITRSYLPGNHGCLTYRSIASISNSPVWVSNDGLCLWDGESISVVNYGKKRLDYPQIKYAFSARDKYYLMMDTGTVVFDRRNGDIFVCRTDKYDYAWYDADRDTVYLQLGNDLYEMVKSGTAPQEALYQSPMIGADTEGIKKFTELRIVCSQSSAINLNIDNRIVRNFTVASGRTRLKLPLECIGEWLQLTIRAKGTLSEVHVIY